MTESDDLARTRQFSWSDPLIGAQAARTMSGREYLEAMVRGEHAPPPVANALDMALDGVGEGRATFTLEPAEFHYNPLGSVHGGVITTLCDSAMTCAVLTLLPAGVGSTTLEIKINFVRPLLLATGRVVCEGTVIHRGGRTATAEARVLDAAGKLYAHATTTCLILRPE
jgi:uncharacterized protein (TIGR00369 family)